MAKFSLGDKPAPENSARDSSLSELSLQAIKWSYFGVFARILAQVGIQIILARLLGPDVFGLFAMAALMVGLGIVVVGLGLGSALIQKKEITDNDIRQTFTWSVLSGLGMTLLTVWLARDFANFFKDYRLENVLYGLTPVFMLLSLSIVPQALLRRELSYKIAQSIEIVSYLFGFLLVGVSCALLGAGIWSLVAAWLAQLASSVLLLLIVRRHSMRPLLRGHYGLCRFGSRVLCTNMANLAIENMDNLMVGKLLGATPLGLYSLAYTFVRTPANHLVLTLQNILFSASSRAQDNRSGLERACLTVTAAVSLIATPVFAGVAAVPHTLVEAFFGTAWMAAAPVLQALSIAMILHASMAVTGPVLAGKGAASAELKVQFWVALILLIAIAVTARYSIEAVAWVVCAVYALRLAGMILMLARHVQIPARSFLRALRGGIIVAVPVVIALLIADATLHDIAPLPRLLINILVAAVVYLGMLRLFQAQVIALELRTVLLTWAERSAYIKKGCRILGMDA